MGFLSGASFGLLALALVCFDRCLERLTVMSQKRRQQKAFRAYWPWLVDLMRIAISGGAAHGVAFDHALTALKHSPLNALGQRVFARRDEGQDRIGAICSVAREMESREALDLGLAMRESAKQGSDGRLGEVDYWRAEHGPINAAIGNGEDTALEVGHLNFAVAGGFSEADDVFFDLRKGFLLTVANDRDH